MCRRVDREMACISIHALLAESDPPFNGPLILREKISIHALLAESDSWFSSL